MEYLGPLIIRRPGNGRFSNFHITDSILPKALFGGPQTLVIFDQRQDKQTTMMLADEISIRKGQLNDLPQVLDIFVASIKKSCVKDYSPEQIEAWTSSIRNMDHWKQRWEKQWTAVATLNNRLLGFASLREDYLDTMYVDRLAQGVGVGGRLLKAIMAEADAQGIDELSSHVSITARPFFLRHGFQEIGPNTVDIHGITLRNYEMRRKVTID